MGRHGNDGRNGERILGGSSEAVWVGTQCQMATCSGLGSLFS